MNKLLLAALSLVAFGAHAGENGMYAGANLGSMNIELREPNLGRNKSYNVRSLEGVFGYQFHKYMKVEARVGLGLDDENEFAYGDPIQRDAVVDDPATMGVDETMRQLPFVEADTPAQGLTRTTNEGAAWETVVKTNYYASIYFRPEIANDIAKLYGLIGFTQMDIAVERNSGTYEDIRITSSDGAIVGGETGANTPTAAFDDDIDDSGLSLGIGVGFFVNEDTVINVEWKNFIQGTDDLETFSSNGLTVGFDMQF